MAPYNSANYANESLSLVPQTPHQPCEPVDVPRRIPMVVYGPGIVATSDSTERVTLADLAHHPHSSARRRSPPTNAKANDPALIDGNSLGREPPRSCSRSCSTVVERPAPVAERLAQPPAIDA
jgi:hypothetical protein